MGKLVRCGKCREIIESKHRHDFVTCSCGNLSVDGGNDYLKVSFIENNWCVVEVKNIKQIERTEYVIKDGTMNVDEDGYIIWNKKCE